MKAFTVVFTTPVMQAMSFNTTHKDLASAESALQTAMSAFLKTKRGEELLASSPGPIPKARILAEMTNLDLVPYYIWKCPPSGPNSPLVGFWEDTAPTDTVTD